MGRGGEGCVCVGGGEGEGGGKVGCCTEYLYMSDSYHYFFYYISESLC